MYRDKILLRIALFWLFLTGIIASIAVIVTLEGCSTVTPKIQEPKAIAFHGSEQNGGIIADTPTGSIIDAELRAKYNGLIEAGWGSKKHFQPPLHKDEGVEPLPDGTYSIDKEHKADLIEMNLLARSGIKP